MSRAALAGLLARRNVAAASNLLDLLSVQPAMSLSLRRLRAGYSGPAIRVVRSSDSTTKEIGFVGNSLDTADLLSFCGSGNGQVDRWYNQHASPAQAFWPGRGAYSRIVESGALVTQNSLVALKTFGNSGQFSLYPSSNVTFTEFTANAVLKKNASTDDAFIFSAENSNYQIVRVASGDIPSVYLEGPIFTTSTATDITSTLAILTTTKNAGGNVDVYRNSDSAIRLTGTSTAGGSLDQLFTLFNIPVPTIFAQELLFFQSELSSTDRAAMIANQRAYYGI